jgi:uncharacterized protein (TIGR00375 family)
MPNTSSEFAADLHVHSHYSRATSKDCTLEGLQHWAQLKGVRVVGTGDFTHPEWSAELREKLEPAAPGLFRLRPAFSAQADANVPESCRSEVLFMLTGEISSIYKRDDRTRKVHSLLLMPDFETAESINARLDALGNISSDGRPILGLDPRDLLEIMLEANPDSVLIPAHIWTPWFSMLGSKSGFDSAEECFGDLTRHIPAVETGLSSDPPMNWRVSALDRFTLVSNSDLHSPKNLARNATLFRCAPDYFAMRDTLHGRAPEAFGGTLDLFPEEGKYHLDGHRKCNVCLEPEDSLARDGLCPVCGKPLTLGVLHRVVALADRPRGGRPEEAPPNGYIIPLPEILSELAGVGPNSKRVQTRYRELLATHGPELAILRQVRPEELPEDVALAVSRLRSGLVKRVAGYDGVYGSIRALG